MPNSKDYKELEKLVKEGYISKQKHPELDIFIYNYTSLTQFNKIWNSWTLACRGLIMDSQYNIVARPFEKFFNLEDYLLLNPTIPKQSFELWEKLDGSLGILYWQDNLPKIATRGSFVSSQAIYATNIILPNYKDYINKLNKKNTYLFEIIYPANRIVVDYDNQEKLVLLAVIETKTGQEKDISETQWLDKAKYFGNFDSLDILDQKEYINKEGFVLKFNSGLRLKYKFNEYKRLHKILTGVTKKDIWLALKNNQSLDNILDSVPDEFYNWVKGTIKELNNEYEKHLFLAKEAIKTNKLDQLDRKSAAKIIIEKYKDMASIIFTILDNKNPSIPIFKTIKPKPEKKSEKIHRFV